MNDLQSFAFLKLKFIGGITGLLVMRGDSCSEGCGFESNHCILDGYIFKYICSKNCTVCLKRRKINEKEACDNPFFKKRLAFINTTYTLWM